MNCRYYKIVRNAHVKLKWTDPNDVIVGSTTLATWKKTVIVRKEGSAPSSETDGTIVVESTTRNELGLLHQKLANVIL